MSVADTSIVTVYHPLNPGAKSLGSARSSGVPFVGPDGDGGVRG